MGHAVLAFQQKGSALQQMQKMDLCDDKLGDCTGSKAAEIAISPDGSLVFATNRETQNTVTVFKTLADGKLSRVGSYAAPRFPRGMALVMDAKILVVGGQSQNEVWSYFVGKDGDLKFITKDHDARVAPHPATFTTFAQYSPHPATFT